VQKHGIFDVPESINALAPSVNRCSGCCPGRHHQYGVSPEFNPQAVRAIKLVVAVSQPAKGANKLSFLVGMIDVADPIRRPRKNVAIRSDATLVGR